MLRCDAMSASILYMPTGLALEQRLCREMATAMPNAQPEALAASLMQKRWAQDTKQARMLIEVAKRLNAAGCFKAR